MSDTAELQKIMADKGWVFYHFTDTRNLPSIRQHGLLSMRALRESGIVVAPGGNDWSIDADKRSGMDRFIHLSFFKGHPMEWLALQDGRIKESRFLRIDSSILALDGVLITDQVSNKAGALPRPADEMIGNLDLEVIYTRTDWKDPKIQARMKKAQKCE